MLKTFSSFELVSLYYTFIQQATEAFLAIITQQRHSCVISATFSLARFINNSPICDSLVDGEKDNVRTASFFRVWHKSVKFKHHVLFLSSIAKKLLAFFFRQHWQFSNIDSTSRGQGFRHHCNV